MTRIGAILQQTGRNLGRTWATQVMTLITVTFSVLLFAFFLLIHLNMLAAGQRLTDDIRLTVYLEDEIAPEMQTRLAQRIREFGEIEAIRFISRQAAFARLAAQLGDERDVLDDLGSDFLPPAIEVAPRRTMRDLAAIEQLAGYLATLPGATKVQYGRDWLQRFGAFTQLLQIIVLVSAVLLVLSMVFIVSYTIRLTVSARREELEVLRLLGASDAYIRTPFLMEGLFQGVFGSGLGLAALFFLFEWITTRFGGPGMLGIFSLDFLPLPLIGLLIAACALLCAGSSLVAVKKFLRI